MSKATMPNYAGLRQWTKSRQTGNYVGVYDGKLAGMDTDGGRWQTVCEPHGNVISHKTLELALPFAPVPKEWCDRCAGAEPVQTAACE